jgi:transcriptional regulator with XRE-family HTH domain
MPTMSPLKVDGAKIRELRLRAGLSQEQLARRSYVAHQTIHRLEGGKTPTARELTLLSLANALGIEPTDLLAAEQSPDALPGS